MNTPSVTRRLALSGLAFSAAAVALPALAATPEATPITVWKDPQCGCCGDWIAHMQANGFAVTLRDTGNAGARARLDGRNAAHQAFMRHFHQALGSTFYLADRIHAAGIAVPAVKDVGDIDIDDVTIAQRLGIRYAVADHMVDGGADRARIAAIIERCRQRAVVHAELEDEPVNRIGVDSRLDHGRKGVKASSGQLAGLAHAVKGILPVQADLPRVAERCGTGVNVADHDVLFRCLEMT